MKILSIHYGHNSSIAYTENGKILNILSEERFTRIKNHWGFPENSINFIKQKYLDDDLANLDKIVIIDKIGDNAKILYDNNFKPVYHFQHNQLNELFKSREKIYKNFKFLYNFIKKTHFNFRKHKRFDKFKFILQKKFKLPQEKIIEYDHHLSHAASFCYFKEYNNNEKYLVFTMDGEGDHKSSTVNILEKIILKKYHKILAKFHLVIFIYI